MHHSRVLRIQKVYGYYSYTNPDKYGDFQVCISAPFCGDIVENY